MDADDLWRLNHSGEPVATGHGDALVVGRVVSWEEGQACIRGVNAQGAFVSGWYDAQVLRYADGRETDMHDAWRGMELYRDVFPDARAWIDANIFVKEVT